MVERGIQPGRALQPEQGHGGVALSVRNPGNCAGSDGGVSVLAFLIDVYS